MKLIKVVATAMIVGGLGFGSAGMGAGVATATPAAPIPLKPGHGNDDFCPPLCGDGGGPNHGEGDFRGGDFRGPDFRGPDFQGPDFRGPDFRGDDRGPWWASNRHDWWDDRNGPPPWGWGPPPPLQWNGGPLPHDINYWGYNVNPVWNDGPRQWGIWLFGLWIPIFGVGFN
jgi:hypothetical protein